MDDKNGYAVFFFPQAIEALGDAIKPYLQDGPAGVHVFCRSIDTGGALIEMTLDAQTTRGETVQMELMVPSSMVRMIVSSRIDETFGFGPRIPLPVAMPTEPARALPVAPVEPVPASAGSDTAPQEPARSQATKGAGGV